MIYIQKGKENTVVTDWYSTTNPVTLDIKIDGKRINKDCNIYDGNEIQVFISDSFLCPEQTLNIVFEDDKKIYFVAETKNTGKGIQDGVDLDKLHQEEQQKIACAKKHFAVFDGVKYQVVERLHELFHQ